MEPKIDVMFPLSDKSTWENNELRYALRALETNFPAMGKVFVVGCKPEWLRNAVHIPAEDCYRRNKDANLINKTLLACFNGISPSFVRSSDDQMILRPVTPADLIPKHGGKVGRTKAEHKWWERWDATRKVLAAKNMPSLFFDTHIPMLYDRDEFVRIAMLFPYGEKMGFCINTLYHNASEKKLGFGEVRGERYGPPVIENGKATPTVEEYLEQFKHFLYLGYNDGQLSDNLKEAIDRAFPKPSQYEVPPPVRVVVPRNVPMATGPGASSPTLTPRVWTYWEGMKSDWISLCLESLRKNVPGIEILDKESFVRMYLNSGGTYDLWERLPQTQYNLHSDFIRCWCLRTFGGIWLDADCIAYKDIRPIWRLVDEGAQLVTYNRPNRRPRQFQYSAVLAAPLGSPIIETYWSIMRIRTMRLSATGKKFPFQSLGPRLLSRAARMNPKATLSLIQPMELVHPFHDGMTRVPEELSPDTVPKEAYCCMLTHRALMHQRAWSRDRLLNSNACISALFRRALA
jgi:hypothetical protein